MMRGNRINITILMVPQALIRWILVKSSRDVGVLVHEVGKQVEL